jgi:plasmid maintenance system antidote protein VapI
MEHKRASAVAYDTTLLEHDMAERGWLATDLARAAGVSDMTVSRFLSGERRTARTADKLARALGKTVRRYLRSSRSAAVA